MNEKLIAAAWGNFNHAQDKVVFATDIDLAFSKGLGATIDLSAKHFGERTARYAVIIEDNKIVDFAVRIENQLTYSPTRATLASSRTLPSTQSLPKSK